jgi:Capsule assembly protein Wzi
LTKIFNTVITGALVCSFAPSSVAQAAGGPNAAQPTDRPGTRSGFDAWSVRSTVFTTLTSADGVVAAIGGPPVDMPWILSPPARGRGGFHGQLTVVDQPDLRLRLGAGWAQVDATRDAPPYPQPTTHRWTLDGSELAWRHAAGEWYASVQRRNWGPGWTGSLILDGAAPPLAAIGWRRPQPMASTSPWWQWMGPWTADIFVGQLAGHQRPERPALIGMRLQLQPVDGLQLGLARTLQWGGRGRDESAQSLMHGLLGKDNQGTSGITTENEPGNQLGGFDWRWQWAGERGYAFYGQLIGEDENGFLPSAYIVQAGLEARWALNSAVLRGFAEWTDLIAGHAYGDQRPRGLTYRSGVFAQGYRHDGMLLGHPAGGDVTLASAGLVLQAADWRLAMVASQGQAQPSSQRFAAGPISGLNASAQMDVDVGQQWGAGLWWWRDALDTQQALQLWWRLRL